MKYKYIPWLEVIEFSLKLSETIRRAYKPEVIIAVSRGGLVPARIISDALGVEELYCIRAKHWGIGGKKYKEPVIIEDNLPISGYKVLVVDDVVDTGLTLKKIVEHLSSRNARELRTAVLHVKPKSVYVPDFYVEKLDEWLWIIYPWTIFEVLKTLGMESGIRDPKKLLGKLNKLTSSSIEEFYSKYIHLLEV